jgi:predicted RNA binding protein YcfA (HicA-like mRNA interferase family)
VSDAAKLFDQMRRNPRDWRIDELCVVAQRFGLNVQQGKGSHVKFRHPAVRLIVVVPTRRPIKEFYVMQLIKLIDQATGAE